MKLATFSFLALLVYVHAADGSGNVTDKPLSMIREGDQARQGYALFALLILALLCMLRASFRLRRGLEVGLFALVTGLLVVVTATPSWAAVHELCAMLLLCLPYAYFAFLLYAARSPWLFLHLSAPLLVWLATNCPGYGLWQKGLIVYFILAANIHFHALSRQLVGRRIISQHRVHFVYPRRRKVFYLVDSDHNWARRKAG